MQMPAYWHWQKLMTRPDVGQQFNGFTNVGFALTVRNLAPGPYRIVAFAHSSWWDRFDTRATAWVDVNVENVTSSSPHIQFDTLTQRSTVPTTFAVNGWAVDLASPDQSGIDAVHIYAYPNWNLASSPTFLGVAAYGGERRDVAARLGPTFANSAFVLNNVTLPPGPYTIVAYAHSTVSGTFSGEAREITVHLPGDPLMAIDSPQNGAIVSQPFLVSGWAVDKDALGLHADVPGIARPGVDAVHIWAFPAAGDAPIFLGPATYGGYRPDVPVSIYPPAAQECAGSHDIDGVCRFEYSGFSTYAQSLPPGNYTIVAYAHSSVTGTFSAQRQAAITVR